MILALSRIRLDGGTQSRDSLDEGVVESYAEAMRGGATFPPIVVFHDGADYWAADGFHRIESSRRTGAPAIVADVRQGTRRDAILYSVGANATHGKPRTNADKRRAVTLLLTDEEWSRKADLWIADKCGVSDKFVGKVRGESMSNGSTSPTRERRDGTSYTLPKPKPVPAADPVTEDAGDAEPESAPRPIATAPRSEPAPAPIVHRDVKPDNASLPPAKRDVEGERRHLFTLLPTDRRLADALWTVGQLTASERRDLLSRISE